MRALQRRVPGSVIDTGRISIRQNVVRHDVLDRRQLRNGNHRRADFQYEFDLPQLQQLVRPKLGLCDSEAINECPIGRVQVPDEHRFIMKMDFAMEIGNREVVEEIIALQTSTEPDLARFQFDCLCLRRPGLDEQSCHNPSLRFGSDRTVNT